MHPLDYTIAVRYGSAGIDPGPLARSFFPVKVSCRTHASRIYGYWYLSHASLQILCITYANRPRRKAIRRSIHDLSPSLRDERSRIRYKCRMIQINLWHILYFYFLFYNSAIILFSAFIQIYFLVFLHSKFQCSHSDSCCPHFSL